MPDQIQCTREYIQHIFTELDSDDSSLCETVLIRDGHYCGHRFSNDQFNAVWFFEENEIKVYDADRKLIRVESYRDDGLRRAA
jgi:hypothetical protein